MNTTPKQRIWMWLVGFILAAIYFAPSIIGTVRQAMLDRQQAAARNARQHARSLRAGQAHEGQPGAPPAASANASASTSSGSAVALPAPASGNSAPALPGNAHADAPAGMATVPLSPPAYNFSVVAAGGTTIGGHTLPPDTLIDPGPQLNDNGEVAFAASWSDARGKDHSAFFTSHRLVAQTGDVIDGRTLLSIMGSFNGSWFAINNAGQVAYEAMYSDPSAMLGAIVGVFVDNHLAILLNAPGRAPLGRPHTFLDDGRILSATGAVIYSPAALPPPPLPASANTPCPLPGFPLPAEWQAASDAGGPIGSQGLDPAMAILTRVYDSPFYGHLTTPLRSILYGSDCRPLVIAIGDASNTTRFEIWTPAGLLTYTKPDGFYAFNGIALKASLDGHFPLARSHVNQRGEVMLLVDTAPASQSAGGKFAVLLATPRGRS